MARKTTDDLDELVEELDELEFDEEAEDPDEAPKRKRTRKATTAKAPKVREGIGTKELAEAAGVEPRQLRMFLRSAGYQPKDDRDGRYQWKSLNDPEAKAIIKKIQAGEVEKMNKEKVAELKTKRTRKAKVAADEDDD